MVANEAIVSCPHLAQYNAHTMHSLARSLTQDVAQRPPVPPTLTNPVDFKRFFGITGWGFTKANELANGRIAMIGFAAALINQMRLGGYAGPGPLAQASDAVVWYFDTLVLIPPAATRQLQAVLLFSSVPNADCALPGHDGHAGLLRIGSLRVHLVGGVCHRSRVRTRPPWQRCGRGGHLLKT